MSNVISFPGLGGLSFNPPETAFSIFGHDIRWYGIIIAFGFMLAFLYGMKRCETFGFNQDQLIDVLFVATPAAIIGARAYYVIFNYGHFTGDPARIFQIWTGGLAIYGAVIGGLLAGAIMAKIKKIKIGALLDLGVLGFLIGQSIGRWGNFVNREAYGAVTSLPWRMEIYDMAMGGRVAVHPTFLYESLWNLLGFVLLHFASKHRRYDGQTFLTYIAWYGLGRGIIEGLRTDSLYFLDTGLRVSQVLGFTSCLIALLLLAYFRLFRRFDPEEMQVARYLAAKEEKASQPLQLDATDKAVLAGNPDFMMQGKLHDDNFVEGIDRNEIVPDPSPIEKVGFSDILNPGDPSGNITPNPDLKSETSQDSDVEGNV